jgi:hypothetical protein
MAIPKNLKEIKKETALKTIAKHLKAGTGEWEGAENISDFVYKQNGKYILIRPPCYGVGPYETGVVSL